MQTNNLFGINIISYKPYINAKSVGPILVPLYIQEYIASGRKSSLGIHVDTIVVAIIP